MKFSSFPLSSAVVIAFAGAFLALGQDKPVPKPSTGTLATEPKPTPEGVGMAVDPNKYSLGPEDVIHIKTWREQDFTLTLAVRPDGKITLPLIGDLQAAGLTPQQLTNDLKDKLGKYINNPDVTVIVLDVRSKRFYIDGEVNRPGPYPLVLPTTVLEALSVCGGFRDFADQKHIKILRGNKTLRFNYKEVTSGKRMEQNILIESGDHIIVR